MQFSFLHGAFVDLRIEKSSFPEFGSILLKNILQFRSNRFKCKEPKSFTMKKRATQQENTSIYLMLTASAYLLTFITTTLINKIVPLSSSGVSLLNTMTSLMQAPMLMMIMLHLTKQNRMIKSIRVFLAIVLGISALAIAMMGMKEFTLLYIIFAGSIPTFGLGSVLLFQLIKNNMEDRTAKGHVLLLSGIIFSSGTFTALLMMHTAEPIKHASDLREILGLITLIASLPLSIGLFMSYHMSVPTLHATDAFSPIKAGKAQWENFSLSNTPDVMKTSVTDISKYYSEVQ